VAGSFVRLLSLGVQPQATRRRFSNLTSKLWVISKEGYYSGQRLKPRLRS